MATDTFIGPQGGDWFDPANWSTGLVPVPGDAANIFLDSTANGSGPSGVDATQSTVAGVTIDLSGTSASFYVSPFDVYYDAAPNLTAAQLGTAASPVALEVTSDGGADSSAAVILGTLNGSLTVEANQSLMVEDYLGQSATDVTINGALTVASGAHVTFEGYNYGGFSDNNPVILNGVARIEGGDAHFDTSLLEGTGSIEIGDGGVASFSDTDPRSTTLDLPVTFDSTGGTLDISAGQIGSQLEGTVTGFGAGDTIALKAESPDYPVITSYANGVLTIEQYSSAIETITFAGDYTLANFDVQFGANALDITYKPCFAAGTAIATPDGDRPVQQLAPGDLVLLADGRTAPIVWTGRRRQHAGTVVRVEAGALAPDVPRRDLVVSTDHALYLDGHLVPAGLLVDDRTIRLEYRDAVSFHHVELARHAILLAEGAPAESYLDTGNRRQFGNCGLTYDPLDAARHEPCAELVLGGQRLEAIRSRRLVTA